MVFILNFLGFIWFLFAIYLAFFIPGVVTTGNILNKKSLFEKITIGLTVGMVIWVFQGLILGYLHLRFLTYLYLLIFALIYSKANKLTFKRIRFKKMSRLDLLITVIFVIGIFGQQFEFFITGFVFPSGVYSIMGSANDSVWHTSMISELIRRFPPIQPGLSGVIVYNYHYLSDFIVADLIRVFRLPLLAAQFQYTSILFSFLLGANAYVLAKTLKFSKSAAIIFVYLEYFSSDAIYILTFFTRHSFIFTVHPLEDGVMFLENPPRALSYIVVLCSVYFLYYLFKTRSLRTGIITILLLGSVIGFKVHTAFGVFGGLGLLSLYLLYKKDFKLMLVPIFTFIVTLLIHVPINKVSGIPFYAPFEMSRMFTVQPDLQLSRLELARRIYESAHNYLGEWRWDLIMLALFLFGQFGIKNVGWIPSKALFKKLGWPISLFLLGAIAGLLIIGTLFYQPIGGADIFNFYLALALFLSLFAAFNLGYLVDKSKILAIVVISFIVIFTIPRWVYEITTFVAYFKVDRTLFYGAELKSLEYLSKNTKENSVILVANTGQADSVYPYVGAFSKRDTFLSGQTVLIGHSIPYKDRQLTVDTIFNSSDSATVKKDLKINHINYIYFLSPSPELSPGLSKIRMNKIFSNKLITIYEVKE